MSAPKIVLLMMLHEHVQDVPYRAVQRLYKFFTDSTVSGEIRFHFHKGRLIGWSNTIGKAKDYPFGRKKQ